MDTVAQYRQQIKTVLENHARHVWDDRIQAQIIIDTEHDHYQLVYVGWRDSKRCYGVVLHIDIIDGKIWIQQDETEISSANELVELGVPKHDIVLGFDPPNLRHYTDFAVN